MNAENATQLIRIVDAPRQYSADRGHDREMSKLRLLEVTR